MIKFQISLIILLLNLSMTSQAESLPVKIIPLDNRTAKDFLIDDYDGKKYRLSSSKGRWIFLHFWASWCGPCRREMPLVHKLQKQLKNENIDFVLINTAEDEDTIFEFLGSVAPDLHSYMDRDGELTEIWAPRGLPTTFFIDPKGRKRYLALGGRPWDEPLYQNFLFELLNEKQD